MGDVGGTAAMPEGRGGGGGGGGGGAGAALGGGLDVCGKAEQAKSWRDEIFSSLAGGPEGGAGALEGFADPTRL